MQTPGTDVEELQPDIHNENSFSVLRGHPLGERVLARQAELESELESLTDGTTEYIGVATALATLGQFLGADLNHLSDSTARDLNNWLERNKYLGMKVKPSSATA